LISGRFVRHDADPVINRAEVTDAASDFCGAATTGSALNKDWAPFIGRFSPD
jgi:hypothetical protein